MKPNKILFISHDASRTGAPIVLLRMLQWLKNYSDIEFDILLLKGGPLSVQFEKLGRTLYFANIVEDHRKKSIFYKIRKKLKNSGTSLQENFLTELISKENYDYLYLNTVSSIPILRYQAVKKVQKILHIHELEIGIKQFCDESQFMKYLYEFESIIVPSDAVKLNLLKNYDLKGARIDRIYEPIIITEINTYCDNISRSDLGIPSDAIIIGGSGTRDWRKGFDIFLAIAGQVQKSQFHFIWVGGESSALDQSKIDYDLERINMKKQFHLIEHVENPSSYYHLFDLFLLTSREDPFPLVCLENAAIGNPIICFEDSGGMPELVSKGCGSVVPYYDMSQMIKVLDKYKSNPKLLQDHGTNAQKFAKEFDIDNFMGQWNLVIDSI